MIGNVINIILLTLLASSVHALPSSAEKDLERYIKIFNSADTLQQKKAAQTLEWAGFTDPRLFDRIEVKLLAGYKTAHNKDDVDYYAWLSKALSFSGQTKYVDTLEKVSKDSHSSKLKKHAGTALQTLPRYTNWNPQIINETLWDPALDVETNRLISMINSNDLSLKRLSAKRSHYSHNYSPKLLETYQQQLLANYQTASNDKLFVDTWAWVTKALAGSALPQYKLTVSKVADGANNRQLKKYAKKYLNYYKN
ncbi:hypothetical protein KOI40_12420 [Aestuariicella sp. G3-2]|uniref:hypothetical protein n=1 Tax=Pseudomaricurvus albidus TaxID=2842452 RepID=UPI001C0D34B9|nr:hypothetical protein [Aestuariicella albida]MBU3070628.1 hypothetical protein [Aestuariicella albida]